ncbi:acyl-CoA N-acyltransferase [Byssothecium circinans]|uniref:Acyl-CoA N-acyltransferase n=1 Tax=Byssothecium circinans TaxID=147558 RepID=A0A6A5U8L9_9PLEO|nr:acyl-CoA N-acyltransferase [Byssothecium circinans]
MAFHIEEATDADITAAMQAEAAAYGANKDAAGAILFPGPSSPDRLELKIQQIIDMRKNDPTTTFLKAVEDETGDLMAFAKWNFYPTEEIAKNAPGRPIPNGPGCNPEACKAFFGGLVQKKAELIGNKPHVYLHMLHTHPKYQKRGAASALIKWGMQKADELGLAVYLESSLQAHTFYHHHGFKDAGRLVVDLQPFGGEEGMTHSAPLLVREPVKQLA